MHWEQNDMDEKSIRTLIVETGRELLENGLVARTWGNVSARCDGERMLITPSGMDYKRITEKDIVLMDILSGEWQGEHKPSGERGVHAAAYNAFPEVGFVIHTHQTAASVLSLAGSDSLELTPEERESLGDIALAGYGLPGTKKLRREVAEAVRKNLQSDAFLMERHGAVVCGKTYEKAFESVNILEERCKELYESRKKTVSQKAAEQPYLDDYAQILGFGRSPVPDEDAEAIALIRTKNSAAASYAQKARRMKCLDVLLQHAVYKMKYSKLKNKQ